MQYVWIRWIWNIYLVVFANIQIFIWFIKILPCQASDLPWWISLMFLQIYSVPVWYKMCPKIQGISADTYFFCLLWHFSWLPALVLCSLYLEICTESYLLFQLYGDYHFFAWIDIVCCGLMNGLFNQELSILQIPEKYWAPSYTAELYRRDFIVIKGREVIKQAQFKHRLGSHFMSYQL